VVYCHGNSGNRTEANDLVQALLPRGLDVFAFDFPGCGLSEGDYVTLGAQEAEHLDTVVKHLKKCPNVGRLALWGRSMGAATVLLYSSQHQEDVDCLVVDSCFTSLYALVQETAKEKFGLSEFLSRFVFKLMKRSIRKRTGHDIEEVDVVRAASACVAPVLFGCANSDTLVRPEHTKEVYSAYRGSDKSLMHFQGSHNSKHHAFTYRARDFLCESMQVVQPRRSFSCKPLLDHVAPKLRTGSVPVKHSGPGGAEAGQGPRGLELMEFRKHLHARYGSSYASSPRAFSEPEANNARALPKVREETRPSEAPAQSWASRSPGAEGGERGVEQVSPGTGWGCGWRLSGTGRGVKSAAPRRDGRGGAQNSQQQSQQYQQARLSPENEFPVVSGMAAVARAATNPCEAQHTGSPRQVPESSGYRRAESMCQMPWQARGSGQDAGSEACEGMQATSSQIHEGMSGEVGPIDQATKEAASESRRDAVQDGVMSRWKGSSVSVVQFDAQTQKRPQRGLRGRSSKPDPKTRASVAEDAHPVARSYMGADLRQKRLSGNSGLWSSAQTSSIPSSSAASTGTQANPVDSLHMAHLNGRHHLNLIGHSPQNSGCPVSGGGANAQSPLAQNIHGYGISKQEAVMQQRFQPHMSSTTMWNSWPREFETPPVWAPPLPGIVSSPPSEEEPCPVLVSEGSSSQAASGLYMQNPVPQIMQQPALADPPVCRSMKILGSDGHLRGYSSSELNTATNPEVPWPRSWTPV